MEEQLLKITNKLVRVVNFSTKLNRSKIEKIEEVYGEDISDLKEDIKDIKQRLEKLEEDAYAKKKAKNF
jgi:selenocysteine-specific translation elongation factor